MNKRIAVAVAAAFTLTTVLTACGTDEENCDSSTQLSSITPMTLDDGRSSGGTGGKSKSGRPTTRKTTKPGKSKSHKTKTDDDLFEECDD